MKLTFMFEQPPTAEPIKHTMTTTERGWMTVLDEHGVPLLRMWVETNVDQPTLGLGVYGPLGDYITSLTLTQGTPMNPWRVSAPEWE